jgi:asparagine synthase (glutamine-hydrolysing)
MGFGVPIDHWFRHELKEMVYEVLLSRRAMERGYFQREYIETILTRHQNGESWQYLIWNLLMLELWHQMFIDEALAPPTVRSEASV